MVVSGIGGGNPRKSPTMIQYLTQLDIYWSLKYYRFMHNKQLNTYGCIEYTQLLSDRGDDIPNSIIYDKH